MALAGSLEILMSAQMQQLVTDMNSAKNTVNSAMSNISSAVNTAKSVLGTLGVAFSVNHFTTMIRNSIDAQAAMHDLSQKIGASVEDLTGLAYAARLVDVDTSTMQRGLRALSLELVNAKDDASESAERFRTLGIDIYDASGKLNSFENIMIQMADAFAEMEDGAEQTDLAVSVFGRTVGMDLIPMLNMGGDALQGMIDKGSEFSGMTTESAAAADELADRLDTMGIRFDGVINRMASALVPLGEKLLDFWGWFGPQYINAALTPFQLLGEAIATLDSKLSGSSTARIEAMNQQSAVANGISLAIPGIQKLRDEMNAAAAETARLAIESRNAAAQIEQMTYVSQGFVGPMQEVTLEAALAANGLSGLTASASEWAYPVNEATGSLNGMLDPLGRVAPTAEDADIALAGMTETIVQQIEPMETYKNLVQGIQNDWADLIYNTLSDGKINFKDFFDSVLQGFLRMVAQMAAADLANAVFGGQGLGALTGGNIAGMINGATGGGGGGGIAGAIGSTVSSIFGGGTAAATAANSVGPMASGYLTAGGTAAGTAAGGTGIMASIGAGISSAASTIWGGVTGTASAIGGGMSAAGSAVMGALQAIPGWGWALAGLGLAAAALDSGGTYSHNAGFLLQPVAGMEGRTFDVDAFDSGFDPIGFNRRTSVEEASAVIDTFRTYDAVLTKLARDSGMNVNYSNAPFNGYDEKGLGNGLFYGSAEEDDGGKGTALDIQLNKFVADWIRALGYQIDPSARDSILAGGTADEMIARAAATMAIDGSHASGLNYVPWDGYKAVLHKGERVQTDAEARAADRSSVELRAVREVLQATQSEMSEMKRYLREMFLINSQWNDDGLPPERV